MHEIRKSGQEKVCRTGRGKVPPKSLECFFSAILQGNCACIPPHSISHPSSPQCSLPLIKREGEGNGGGGGIGDEYRALARKKEEEEEEGGSFKSDYQISPWLLLGNGGRQTFLTVGRRRDGPPLPPLFSHARNLYRCENFPGTRSALFCEAFHFPLRARSPSFVCKTCKAYFDVERVPTEGDTICPFPF